MRRIIEDRGISVLLHFTQAANLRGIVEHGLLPRRELENPRYTAHASDRFRLDDDADAVSVSVSRVNARMFASKRRKSGHEDWLVLALSVEILWTHRCRFCWRNAARNEIKRHRGRRDGAWAFEKMFERTEVGVEVPRAYPTDPEAEIQVLDPISPDCILGAVVGHPGRVARAQTILDALPDANVLLDVGWIECTG